MQKVDQPKSLNGHTSFMTADNLPNFTYKGEFNPVPIRHQLDLDGHNPLPLRPEEKGRLATLLLENGYITREEIASLGGRIKNADGKNCRV